MYVYVNGVEKVFLGILNLIPLILDWEYHIVDKVFKKILCI